MMNDDQVAAVVNYVRTHFGNDYRDAVTRKMSKPSAAEMWRHVSRRRRNFALAPLPRSTTTHAVYSVMCH